MKHLVFVISVFCLFYFIKTSAQDVSGETLSPLKDGVPPQTVDELWKGIDPRKEPLEIEILKEWEHDNVTMKIVRYRIGIFKGQYSMESFGDIPKSATQHALIGEDSRMVNSNDVLEIRLEKASGFVVRIKLNKKS